MNSTGRVDLLGRERGHHLAEQLYSTLRDFSLQLPDGVIVYPGHGPGSPCGVEISGRQVTTIGYERLHTATSPSAPLLRSQLIFLE